MAYHQEEMLYEFLYKDAIQKEYQAIMENTDNPIYAVKKIMAAMETVVSAKR